METQYKMICLHCLTETKQDYCPICFSSDLERYSEYEARINYQSRMYNE